MHHNGSLSRRRFVYAALGAASAVPLCAEEPKPQAPGYNTMTDEQEIELGRKAAAEIEKELKLTFIEDRSVRDYASKLLFVISRTSRRPNLPYSVKVVNTDEVNAFALPGGFVYLNRGLMEWARTESELVGVLSHEVGHVVGRHGANSVSRGRAADSLLSEASQILLGDDLPAQVLKQVGGPAAALALLKYSRTQEFEADLLGYYNMQRAGSAPQGMVELFQHFGEARGGGDSLFAILSSHPAPSEREAQIRDEMKRFPFKEGLVRNTDTFRAVQAKLKNMAPAPKPERRSSAN